jgi:RNA polymerase sigma-B factor
VSSARLDDHDADAARHRLIESYLPLVRAVARRFAGRGERVEDLVQVGSIGVITAVDRCDPGRRELLTAYVARTVEGEIRRHLRDRCSVVRIPRSVQALQWADEANDADQALYRARFALSVEEHATDEAVDGAAEEVGLARALIASAWRALDSREQRVILLRYFLDLNQVEVGRAVGVSQVHASRLLHGAIAKMRADLEPDHPSADLLGSAERR